MLILLLFIISLISYSVLWYTKLIVVAKQFKLDIRSDQGAYTAIFTLQDWDLIRPVMMTTSDFEALRGRLKGFSEVTKVYTFDQLNLQTLSVDSMSEEIIRRIERDVHIHVVQGGDSEEQQEIMLAGALRKNTAMVEEKVMISILLSE